jgi:2-polyprenyl-6-methoxyphenol hydroxylase-like FAD-dependent oxidoreductase
MVPSRDRVDVDLAIVGGGIAGGALATVMARRGARVLLLERATRYRDHIRGEILWQWGLAEARRLGLEDVLRAAGGLIVPRFVFFDEGAPPAPEDLADAVAGIPGSLNLAHPVACQALSDAAVVAGADVRHGIENVRISPGRDPAVRWSMDGREETASARLLVGADGRRSTVRQQVGIGLDIDAPGNCIAGLYVDGLEGTDDRNVMAREADLLFYAFPQRGGRARLYLTFPAEQRNRLAGGGSASRFLSQASLACLSAADRWTTGRIAGPCATYLCSDARAERVSVEGLVLIGDAAGYENPLQGLGLSFAMRDVRELSELLFASSDWTGELLEGFGAQRSRLRRLSKLATQLDLWINEGYHVQDPAERARRLERAGRDDIVRTLVDAAFVGFDSLPARLTPAEMWERLGVAGYGDSPQRERHAR